MQWTVNRPSHTSKPFLLSEPFPLKVKSSHHTWKVKHPKPLNSKVKLYVAPEKSTHFPQGGHQYVKIKFRELYTFFQETQ